MTPIFLALAACAVVIPGVPPKTPGPDDSDAAFPVDHVLEIAITLAELDWDTCRNQTRSVWELFSGECLAEPFESPFTWFDGSVIIDGESWDHVGVKKKGFLGSLDLYKPGLKIRFDTYAEGGAFHDLHKIALNNTPQDPTMLHTCLAYEVFRRDGVPAPRCGFAHVTVNDEDLGVYSVVEPVDADFIARNFPGEQGALYEGTVADFREGWTGTFEGETDAADGRDIAAVTDALTADDGALIDTLDAVVDLDQYYDFWAAESLTGHWDGYNGNTNNFYVYNNPATGKFVFIPWGADAAFQAQDSFGEGAPVWVVATSALANRLINSEEGRVAYRTALLDLLADAWDEDAMVEEVNRMAALIRPFMGSGWEAAVEELLTIVKRKEGKITRGMDDGADFSAELRGPPCFRDMGDFAGTFETTFGTYPDQDVFTTGDAAFHATWEDSSWDLPDAGAAAGLAEDGSGTGVVMLAAVATDGTRLIPYVAANPADIETGADLEFDFVHTTGAVYYMNSQTGGDYALAAYLADGGIHFDEADTTTGASVRGTMTGRLVAWGW